MFLLDGIIQALLLALVIDWLVGDPRWLYGHLPHPIVMMGRLLNKFELRWFDQSHGADGLYRQGRVTTLLLVLPFVGLGLVIQWLCLSLPYGWVVLGIVMSTLLAQAGLADHVRAVARGLDQGLAEGREAVSHIVGRDPERLDRHGVARSAIESLAENFSDGVVAPAFYAFFLGLPGMLAYKAINTADSMIGHRSERYLHFGRFAARLDDVANWLPARLSAWLIAIGARLHRGYRLADSWAIMRRDAPLHRSPNGGWPEAAMAGALRIRLSGPRSYEGRLTDDPWIGSGTPNLTSRHIYRALRLFWWACSVLGGFLLLALLLV